MQKKLKIFIVRKKLMNRALFASFIMSILYFALSITMFVSGYLIIPMLVLLVSVSQLIVECICFYKLNYGYMNNKLINKYKKIWIFLLITCNFLGAIYFKLLVYKYKD